MALAACTGFEFGTTAGLTTGNGGNRLFDFFNGTLGTNVIVTAGAAKNGGYGLRLTGGSTFRLSWDTGTLGASKTTVCTAFWWRPQADASGSRQITVVDLTGNANAASLSYNPSTDLLTASADDGSTANSSVTIATNVWAFIEFEYDVTANPHKLNWRIDGVDQPTVTSATAATTVDVLIIGDEASASSGGTMDYDDVVASTTIGDHPLGQHKVVLLSVDPAGTVGLSGTAGNFNTFTANGTLAGWNATTARNNIDEIPPTVGASADGWVQITTAASDYVEMPMTTVNIGAGEVIRGARMLAAGWATDATAGTIGLRSWNGTTETTLYAAADPNFDASTTAPAWVCKMLTPADIDTQQKLDSLAFRAGFSSDALPDMGIHAIYAEVAVRLAALDPNQGAPKSGPEFPFLPGRELFKATWDLFADSSLPQVEGTTVNAECATATADNPDAHADITVNAEAATAASAAVDAEVLVGASLIAMAGMEAGTTAGLVTGNETNKIFDSFTGTLGSTIQVIAGAAKNGGYGLRVSGSNQFVRWYDTGTLGTGRRQVVTGFWWRASTNPGATKSMLVFYVTGLAEKQLNYNPSTDKLVTANMTTNATSTATISPNTWYWIDVHYDTSANPHVLKWSIDGTAQTNASNAEAAADTVSVVIGESATAEGTGVNDYDDILLSITPSNYPLGAHKIQGLSVDPAGTVTLSGTTGNFNTFTANGTLAAWNATTARNNIDELPPTVGASADGWVQISNASSDYVEMPMTTYTLASGEMVNGVRMLAAGWATDATAATFGLRSWNGTTETILFATGDPNFDASTTAPAWVCKMLSLIDINTQGELDALAFRAGFSDDATPDIGIHAIYAEVAVKLATGTTVNAECATATADNPDAHADIAVNAAEATGTSATADAIPSIGVSAVEALGTSAGADAQVLISVNPLTAAGTSATADATPSVGASAECATGTSATADPTVLTGTSAPAECATGTSVTADPQVFISVNVGAATGTPASVDAIPSVGPSPAAATGTPAIADPQVFISVNPTTATGTPATVDPSVAIAVNVETATGTSATADATISTTAPVNAAEAAGAADTADPQVFISVNAIEATGTSATVDGTPSVAVSAAQATGIPATADAQASISASAVTATGTPATVDPQVFIAVNVETASGVGVANDATVTTFTVVTVFPTEAPGTAAGVDAQAFIAASAVQAAGASAVVDPNPAIAVNTTQAAATAIVDNAAAGVGQQAGLASGTAATMDPLVAIRVMVELAVAVAAAYDAVIGLPPPPPLTFDGSTSQAGDLGGVGAGARQVDGRATHTGDLGGASMAAGQVDGAAAVTGGLG